MNPSVFYVIVATLVGLWGVTVYNRLVRFGSRRDEGWSGVSVQLKRRHDLVPNLVASAKGLAGHEKELLLRPARRREAVRPAKSPPPRAPLPPLWDASLPSPKPIPRSRPTVPSATSWAS